MSDLFSIAGKTAVITGGSRGIGKMMASGFVDAGAKVYICARKEADCLATAAELSERGECVAIPANLSTEAECRRVADLIAEREDRLHILVNNAGANWFAPIAEHDDKAWDKVLSLNLKGLFHLTRFLLPLIEAAATDEDPGRIINVASRGAVPGE